MEYRTHALTDLITRRRRQGPERGNLEYRNGWTQRTPERNVGRSTLLLWLEIGQTWAVHTGESSLSGSVILRYKETLAGMIQRQSLRSANKLVTKRMKTVFYQRRGTIRGEMRQEWSRTEEFLAFTLLPKCHPQTEESENTQLGAPVETRYTADTVAHHFAQVQVALAIKRLERMRVQAAWNSFGRATAGRAPNTSKN